MLFMGINNNLQMLASYRIFCHLLSSYITQYFRYLHLDFLSAVLGKLCQ